jgi:hypothetical protein
MPSSPGDSSLPNWALAEADAALRLCLSVPEIERRLVAKGLPPATATAVVNAVLDARLRASSAPPDTGDQSLMVHRGASAVVACVCLGLAFAFGGGESIGRTVLWLITPLAAIWWAETMESSAPPALVRWVAWGVLLLIVGYRVVLLSL